MGLLSVQGHPLTWEESLPYIPFIKQHGIEQFLHIYNAQKSRQDDLFLWGDEIEGMLVLLPHTCSGPQLVLCGYDVIEAVERLQSGLDPSDQNAHFLPEYGRFMVEATPARPYGSYTTDLAQVEVNMKTRRRLLEHVLTPDERYVTMAVFPTMGVENFTHRPYPLFGATSMSQYCPDEIINQHPRFPTLTANIRRRRLEKVDIRVPLFMDARTQFEETKIDLGANFELTEEALEARSAFSHRALCDSCAAAAAAAETARAQEAKAEFDKYQSEHESKCNLEVPPIDSLRGRTHDTSSSSSSEKPYIHGDCMGFGMGCCCLQVTFQARNLSEARHLYDQLAVLSPIFLALTAASPFFRGHLADTDVRWSIISQSVDDRTPQERGLSEINDEARQNGVQRIAKSRYDSIDCFLSDLPSHKEQYNDLPVSIDQKSFDTLRAAQVDEKLARHIAHLFIRDPLVIYKERIEIDNAQNSDHFENIQSTNWQTVRFKPPPPNSPIGWRVEFRSMEIQLTDFENAAFAVFITLVSRAILFFHLNLYMPISKVDENLKRAHSRNAVNREKFFFRRHIRRSGTCAASVEADDDSLEEMSIADIFVGKSVERPGLIPLVQCYLDIIQCDVHTRAIVENYISLVRDRALGKLQTAAEYMRAFIREHPDYQLDSIITSKISRDLIERCDQIAHHRFEAPELLGDLLDRADAASSAAADAKDSETQSAPQTPAAEEAAEEFDEDDHDGHDDLASASLVDPSRGQYLLASELSANGAVPCGSALFASAQASMPCVQMQELLKRHLSADSAATLVALGTSSDASIQLRAATEFQDKRAPKTGVSPVIRASPAVTPVGMLDLGSL